MIPPLLTQKRQRLEQIVLGLRRVIVAFSGGVDSTLILKVAADVLGPHRVLAATGVSPSLPQRELQSVRDLAAQIGVELRLISTSEMHDPNYTANPSNRCYFCKSELYTRLADLAKAQQGGQGEHEGRGEEGEWALVNGANLDDVGDFRPGMKA